MPSESQPEAWLRGPIEGIPPLLQPVAHALLQAAEEVGPALEGFPAERLWARPGGVASVGFHLQHMSGVVDRLFTYARGEPLTPEQLAALAAEREPPAGGTDGGRLVAAFRDQVRLALDQLRRTDERTLTEGRGVGRKALPSTVLGLLFHAAEHVQRHLGQLLVTARVQRTQTESGH